MMIDGSMIFGRVLPLLVLGAGGLNAFPAASSFPEPHGREIGVPGRPVLGVYRTVGEVGVLGNAEFSRWLGRPVLLGHDSMPTVATWDHLRGEAWLLDPWRRWKAEDPRRRFVLSVALLPGRPDLKGPEVGPGAGIPISWSAAARGEYKGVFTVLASNLIRAGLGDSILRLGWEMNGDWYAWSAAGHEAEFAMAWRHVVSAMRAVPGAEKLSFCFNVSDDLGVLDAEKAWPGDVFVDTVGVDLYDWSWQPETYPYPEGSSPSEIEKRQRIVWDRQHLPRLRHWSRFASNHGKNLWFPEWGLCARESKGHGGGDNPLFVREFHAFIHDPANRVVAASYFDCSLEGDPENQFRICPDAKGFTRYPRAAEEFVRLFSGAAPRADAPAP